MAVSGGTKEAWRELTRADLALIALLLGGALATLLWNPAAVPGASAVRIEVAGKPWGEYSLTRLRLIHVRGPIGESVVRIDEDGAEVISAPCVHQLCRRQGRIHRRGQTIVCVPNQLVVTMIGAAPAADIDALIR